MLLYLPPHVRNAKLLKKCFKQGTLCSADIQLFLPFLFFTIYLSVQLLRQGQCCFSFVSKPLSFPTYNLYCSNHLLIFMQNRSFPLSVPELILSYIYLSYRQRSPQLGTHTLIELQLRIVTNVDDVEFLTHCSFFTLYFEVI